MSSPRLQPGMSVQSNPDAGAFGRPVHYAYCCRCRWTSPYCRFPAAQAIARTPDSHECAQPRPE